MMASKFALLLGSSSPLPSAEEADVESSEELLAPVAGAVEDSGDKKGMQSFEIEQDVQSSSSTNGCNVEEQEEVADDVVEAKPSLWRRAPEWDPWLGEEEEIPDCPFEATYAERWEYCREHWGRQVAAFFSLHASTTLWAGLWDLLQYCTIAKEWPGIDYDDGLDDGALISLNRDWSYVFLGGVVLLTLDSFHSNGNVPGEVGGWVTRFWERTDVLAVRWPRAIVCYVAQVMMTCGLYSIFADSLWSVTMRRDWAYALCGLALSSSVDVTCCHAEMCARSREEKDCSSTEQCCASRWDLSFGERRRHRPVFAFGLAVVSYIGQVMTWVGFDQLLEEWLYPGVWHQWESGCSSPCLFGPRHWYHQLIWMFLGLLLMYGTSTATSWGNAACRMNPNRPPHVQSFLVPPEGPSTPAALLKAFVRTVVSTTGYYLHLTALWYFLDEDITTNSQFAGGDYDRGSTKRNTTYVIVGFVVLYASGCFWNDAF